MEKEDKCTYASLNALESLAVKQQPQLFPPFFISTPSLFLFLLPDPILMPSLFRRHSHSQMKLM